MLYVINHFLRGNGKDLTPGKIIRGDELPGADLERLLRLGALTPTAEPKPQCIVNEDFENAVRDMELEAGLAEDPEADSEREIPDDELADAFVKPEPVPEPTRVRKKK